jgi:hypothetical protein
MHRTLLYPGAGWDNEFLVYFKYMGYKDFILYDTLPNVKHYEKGMNGYKYQENFLETLKEKFGSYIVKKPNILYFEEHNLTYYINTNFSELDSYPEGDILIAGYYCEEKVEIYSERIVYLSCHNVYFPHDFKVHIQNKDFKGVCYCSYNNNFEKNSYTESDSESV